MSTPLRIVVVNHVNPRHHHVSALRMRTFAEQLTKFGDKVVLLSDRYDTEDTGTSPAAFTQLMNAHDWSAPLSVSTAPPLDSLIAKARIGGLPSGIRQGVIAWSYFTRGGVFTDWRDAAAPLVSAVANEFRPDIVIATFGNTDAWAIGERLAYEARIPWIADLKDTWSRFIPFGFRARTARRFSSMAHMTAYSENHRAEAMRWFAAPITVIYSGYDNACLRDTGNSHSASRDILLSGSLYGSPYVRTFCEGVREFIDQSGKSDIRLVYAGNDIAQFENAAEALKGACTIHSVGYLPADELWALQSQALANVYIFNSRSLFQQKVLELLAAGWPVIAVPGETDEAVRIAERVGGTLHLAGNANAISKALKNACEDHKPVPGNAIEAYSWAAQTAHLRNVMLHVIDEMK